MSHCGVKCHVHGIRSFEKLQDHLLFAVTDHHDGALQCPRCKNYVCNICIRSYISLQHTRLKSISYQLLKHQMFKDMIKYLQEYERGGEKIKHFTNKGPCCTIIRIEAEKEYEIGFDFDNSNIYDKDIDIDIEESNPTKNKQPNKKRKVRERKARLKSRSIISTRICNTYTTENLDGALHIPSHHLLVHLPIGVPSTHAMGDQRSAKESGLFHACVHPLTASEISTEDFYNSPKKTSVMKTYTTECTVVTPDGIEVKRNTWWAELAIDRTVKTKKHKSPNKEDILLSSFIKLPPGFDSYAILGEPHNPKAAFHLIQMSFPKKSQIFPLISDNMDGLFTNLLRRSGKKGIEASRSGGSQGTCDFNDLVKKHLKNPGSFPRHSSGMLIIVLNSKNRCGYFGIYCCPYTPEVTLKTWFYNTPRLGGHQKLRDCQLDRFPVLTHFPTCRVETAQLLMHRNSMFTQNIACPKAALSMLGEWEEAKHMQQSDAFKKSQGYYLAKKCRITLLAHAVGYHRDTFSNNSGDKIENKLLLVSHDSSNTKLDVALGRGGAGPGVFVYALLDW
mmetsp:Transcript_23622/g.34712  ORF Transcript_23622/g.34712 Transcript_23622/m.34712 type:complete len:561 (+) Transcript_23622:138-1820(+)